MSDKRSADTVDDPATKKLHADFEESQEYMAAKAAKKEEDRLGEEAAEAAKKEEDRLGEEAAEAAKKEEDRLGEEAADSAEAAKKEEDRLEKEAAEAALKTIEVVKSADGQASKKMILELGGGIQATCKMLKEKLKGDEDDEDDEDDDDFFVKLSVRKCLVHPEAKGMAIKIDNVK